MQRNGKPHSGHLADDVEAMLTQVVAEAWGATTSASDVEDTGWRRRGSLSRDDRRTLEDLEYARLQTRRLLEGSYYDDGNEFAIGAAENRVNYVVGETGLQYEATAAKGVPEEPALVAEAQAFIDAFGELNNLPEMEGETLLRGDRDGEAFVRLFAADGIPAARFVQPERVAPPPKEGGYEVPGGYGDVACDEWGVYHLRGDRGRRVGYAVDCGGGPEFVPEFELMHFSLNTTSDCPRGWPTFEPVRRSLLRAEELLVAMAATGKARAKIALITTIPGWNAAKADALLARLTTKYQDQPSGEAPREQTVEELPYGAHLRVREGTNIQFPPPSLGSGDLVEAIQAQLRCAAQRLVMPEWMFSGMADQKYSNAFVVESPALRSFRKLQRLLVQFFGEGRMGHRASLVWRAMRMAARAGVLNPAVLRAVRIKCTPPSLETRDKNAEAQAHSLYIEKGVLPVAFVQQALGHDPAELKKLKEKFPDPAPAGAGPGGPEPAGGPAPPESGEPAPLAAGEGPVAEALRAFAAAWVAEGGGRG